MRKLLRLLFRLLLWATFFWLCALAVNTFTFSSKQKKVEPVEKTAIADAVIQRFAQALSFPTISYESHTDTTVFLNLDTFIQKNYPLLDSLLEKEKVGDLSLVFKWSGKNPKLDPILLTAHLDVVPVGEADSDKWTVPPFEGTVKDNFIWGRGALDDKSSVFGILEAIEMLLAVDYRPQRTVWLAFGHDEEVSGLKGAKQIAKLFEKRNFHFEFVLDEGAMILEEAMAGLSEPLAMIGVAEKGYATLTLTAILKEGGHSAMPPKETAAGILSQAILALQDKPFPAKIDGAVASMFEHVGPEMNWLHKTLFANLWCMDDLIINQLEQKPAPNALVRTTIAPTLLRGGYKENVLPTKVSAKVNLRILSGETIESALEYVRQTIDDERVIVSLSESSEPSMPSPISSIESFGYEIIQTSIQELYPNVVVAPSLVIAATDSRHYTTVSDHIYRFQPLQLKHEDLNRFHGKDERISIENYKQGIRFYRQLILNACR